MSQHYFIAGDWGTSNLRLYLCEYTSNAQVNLIETRNGPGVAAISGDFEDRFFNLTQDWLTQHGNVPVILSGMIGANIGWHETPYTPCPAGADEIARGRNSFIARGLEFSILSGLRTVNPLQQSDIMRGEELQMLGWLRTNSQPANERRLFALPGTHNKWTLVSGQKLQTFITAFTGELYALLRKESILITDDQAHALNQAEFLEGVRLIENLGPAHLVHALFTVRSRQVLGEMANADGLAYLSGLIIAADVMGAIALFDNIEAVTVIGESELSKQYTIVLDYLNIKSECCEPAKIAVAGYAAIYQALYVAQ